MRPVVSCLMPTFNRAWLDPKMVGEAVYWFLQQDFAEGKRELIILCDAPDGYLQLEETKGGRGDYDIKVVNHPLRYPDLATKFDDLVDHALGHIIFPWEDDDVCLPWHISSTLKAMETSGADYINPKGAFLQNGQGPLSYCSPHSVHHNASCYFKDAWRRVGGYAGGGNKQDLVMDQRLRRGVKTFDRFVTPQAMSYVYRWGHSPKCKHLSGHTDPNAGWATEPNPTGTAVIVPAMGRDYVTEANLLIRG